MKRRRATIGCRVLKEKCLDLVTDDRIAFWEQTIIRMSELKLSISGLLKLGLKRPDR
jgi:hypothetical protein